jgi:hypothetical protein
MRRGQIVICGLVQLALLYSARTRDDVLALRGELSALRDLPITRSHLDAAIAALVELAGVLGFESVWLAPAGELA